VRNPFETIKYAISLFKKTDKHYLGHNPLGAIMVVALLLAILIQAVTGLFANDEIFNTGPLYGYITNTLSLQLTSLHRQLFYWILAAVVLHIAAVLIHVVFKRDNIIKAMFTGKKFAQDAENEQSIRSSRIVLAIIILIILALTLTWVIAHAPAAATSEDY
jgi:cytochrome b